MGYVNGYWRKDGTYVQGYQRNTYQDGGGEAFVLLVLLFLITVPIAFVRTIYRSPRWHHATRAACLLVAASAALIFQHYLWNQYNAATSDLALARSAAASNLDGQASAFATQQIADALSAQAGAHRAWLSVHLAFIFVSSWAGIEWLVAVLITWRRYIAYCAAKANLMAAGEMVSLDHEPWELQKEQFLAAARSHQLNHNLSDFNQAKADLREEIDQCQTSIDSFRQAEVAFRMARSTAEPPINDLMLIEYTWQDACAEASHAEIQYAFIGEQFDTHRRARALVPASYSLREWAAIEQAHETCHGEVIEARQGVLEMNQLREDAMWQARAAAALRAPGWYSRCMVCGRPLSDPESMARGVGPTCWSRL